MRRAERLFQLIHLLSRRRFATAAHLGERLEVSQRTIYRDVAHLISSGVPIDGEAGVGYRLDPSYRLAPLLFSTSEVEALAIGMRMVESWGDDALGTAARSVIDKIATVVSGSSAHALERTALFSLSFGRRGQATQYLSQLRNAVNATCKVHFGYRDVSGRPSTRTVRPLGLFFWGQTWTLAAWCELRNGFRNFRLDRLLSLEVTHDVFELAPPCTLEDYRRAMEAEHPPPD
jgi:predicted DNA-binding transcriptional regulator YafY